MNMDGPTDAASTLLALHNKEVVNIPSSPTKVMQTPTMMSTPPTKFSLATIKRKSECMMHLVYVNEANTSIVVPVRPGDTKDVISKRQRQVAQMEQEKTMRLVAYSTWQGKLVSYRHVPMSWTIMNASSTQERFAYKYIQHVKIFAACKQKGVRPLCIGCKNKQPCDDLTVLHYLLPHPSTCTHGNHKLCDKSLEVFCPLPIEDSDDDVSEWLKYIPTCAICS
jgi:hypothetical protein